LLDEALTNLLDRGPVDRDGFGDAFIGPGRPGKI